MKIVVFGATGGTGKEVVTRALRDHDVVAVARRPEAVTAKHDRLRVVKGDVLDAASVAAAMTGADAVISTIGPANNKEPGTLISQGVEHMIVACKHTGVQRFVFESGLMVGDGRGLSLFGRLGVAVFRRLNAKLCADKRIAELAIQHSALDWVIVRPVTLVDAPARGDYKFGIDARLNPAKKLSHADTADFLVRVSEDPKFVRTIQDVGH